MKLHRTNTKGFSLVELLAVVLILAVLAAVAVPLYLNTRKTSAARACKANINAIASAESAYALRNGVYCDMATLVSSSPEGLSGSVYCPLGTTGGGANSVYYVGTDTTSSISGTTKSTLFISCPNATTHQGDLTGSTVGDWRRTMSSIGSDNQP